MACGVTQDGLAFYLLQTGQQASLDVITTGATTRATARVDGGKITEFIIQEPEVVMDKPTNMTIIDNNNTKDISYNIRMANGTVGQVEFTNRGTGYTPNIGVTVDGDGYADLTKTGDKLIVKELSREWTCDNLYITGINDIHYAVQSQQT